MAMNKDLKAAVMALFGIERAKRIRDLMQIHGWNQVELGEQIDMNQSEVSRILRMYDGQLTQSPRTFERASPVGEAERPERVAKTSFSMAPNIVFEYFDLKAMRIVSGQLERWEYEKVWKEGRLRFQQETLRGQHIIPTSPRGE